jgi:hypothetical protein
MLTGEARRFRIFVTGLPSDFSSGKVYFAMKKRD